MRRGQGSPCAIYTLYDIYNDFRCNDNMIRITITDYQGVYKIGDISNCMFKGGTEVDYIIKEIYENYIVVEIRKR